MLKKQIEIGQSDLPCIYEDGSIPKYLTIRQTFYGDRSFRSEDTDQNERGKKTKMSKISSYLSRQF